MNDLTNEFLNFEVENNLFNIEIQNLKFWSLTREYIYFDIIKQNKNTGKAHSDFDNQSRLKKIKGILSFLVNTITRSKLIFRKKDVVVINHSRRVFDGKYYNCLYTDLLLKNIDVSYYVYEIANFGEHRQPVSTKNLIYSDYFDLKFYIQYYINRITHINRLTYNETEYLKKLVSKLNSRFNAEINTIELINRIEKSILMHSILIKQYTSILKRINPRLIIEVNGYERRRKAINYAAKTLNIPTIELQHGTMGKYHIAYNFAKQMDLSTFPDYIFTFGQYWKDNTRLPINNNKVKVVGWPYFEKKVNAYKDKDENTKPDKKTILFISQGTVGKELSQIAVKLSKKVDNEKYVILFKLHPGEYARWKNEYPWLIGADLEVVDHNQYDMHYYFTKSDIQIGVYSTALFEGLGYGLKTYILKLYGYQFMEQLYNNKIAHLVTDENEILDSIYEKEQEAKDFNIDYLWEKNSLNKMLSEIDSIINKGLDHKNEN